MQGKLRSTLSSITVKRKDEYKESLSIAIEKACTDQDVKRQCVYDKAQALPRERLIGYLQEQSALLLKPNCRDYEEVKGLSGGVISNFLAGCAVNSSAAWAICRVLSRFNPKLPYPSVILEPSHLSNLHPWDRMVSTAKVTDCIEPKLDGSKRHRTIVSAGQYELPDGAYFRITFNPTLLGNDINVINWYLTLLNRSCKNEHFLIFPLSLTKTDQISQDLFYIPAKGYKPFRVVGHDDGSLRQEEFLAILTELPLALSWIHEIIPGKPIHLQEQELEQIYSRLNAHSNWLSLFTWFDVVTED